MDEFQEAVWHLKLGLLKFVTAYDDISPQVNDTITMKRKA